MNTVTLFAVLIITLIIYVYIKLQRCYSYWKDRNIPYLKPVLLIGNAGDLILGKKSMLEYQCDLYSKIGNSKLLGIFMFTKPTLYINDRNMIKHILCKDFMYFQNRGLEFDTRLEPLTKHLFHIEGEQWKYLKQRLLPFFQPEAIRMMFPSMLQCATNLQDSFEAYVEQDVNINTTIGSYATDVIALCAFGVNCNTLKINDSIFRVMSKKIFAPRIRTLLKLILPKLPSLIVQLFDIKFVATDVSNFFLRVITQEISDRNYKNETKPDFLNLLLNLRKELQEESGKNEKTNIIDFNEEMIAAQCFLFFSAGYENTVSVLCFTLFELSRNKDIQDKLYKEIEKNLQSGITYDSVLKFKYLDAAISETLRLYPPATALVRMCSEDYKLPGCDTILEKGIQVIIPLCGINRDSQYYENAEQYNPDRFLDDSTLRYVFMPFGEGPRACTGRRFGFTEIKIALIMLLRKYEFTLSEKMHLPIEIERKTFVAGIKGGTWLKCQRRT